MLRAGATGDARHGRGQQRRAEQQRLDGDRLREAATEPDAVVGQLCVRHPHAEDRRDPVREPVSDPEEAPDYFQWIGAQGFLGSSPP